VIIEFALLYAILCVCLLSSHAYPNLLGTKRLGFFVCLLNIISATVLLTFLFLNFIAVNWSR
jgi:prophage maintenance system killer protein